MKPALLTLLTLLSFISTVKAQTETIVQFGHIGYAVTEMELSPDGKFLASADGQILKIWEMESGLEYRTIAGENNPLGGIGAFDFSKDGGHILYIERGNARLFNFKTGKATKTWSLDEASAETDDEEAEPTDEEIKIGRAHV